MVSFCSTIVIQWFVLCVCEEVSGTDGASVGHVRCSKLDNIMWFHCEFLRLLTASSRSIERKPGFMFTRADVEPSLHLG